MYLKYFQQTGHSSQMGLDIYTHCCFHRSRPKKCQMKITAISTGQTKGPAELTDKVYSQLPSVLEETAEAPEWAAMHHTTQGPTEGMDASEEKYLLGNSGHELVCVSDYLNRYELHFHCFLFLMMPLFLLYT